MSLKACFICYYVHVNVIWAKPMYRDQFRCLLNSILLRWIKMEYLRLYKYVITMSTQNPNAHFIYTSHHYVRHLRDEKGFGIEAEQLTVALSRLCPLSPMILYIGFLYIYESLKLLNHPRICLINNWTDFFVFVFCLCMVVLLSVSIYRLHE